jgi:hypothetical protein
MGSDEVQDKELEFHLPMAMESRHDMFDWLSYLELKACEAWVRRVLHVDVKGGVVGSCGGQLTFSAALCR